MTKKINIRIILIMIFVILVGFKTTLINAEEVNNGVNQSTTIESDFKNLGIDINLYPLLTDEKTNIWHLIAMAEEYDDQGNVDIWIYLFNPYELYTGPTVPEGYTLKGFSYYFDFYYGDEFELLILQNYILFDDNTNVNIDDCEKYKNIKTTSNNTNIIAIPFKTNLNINMNTDLTRKYTVSTAKIIPILQFINDDYAQMSELDGFGDVYCDGIDFEFNTIKNSESTTVTVENKFDTVMVVSDIVTPTIDFYPKDNFIDIVNAIFKNDADFIRLYYINFNLPIEIKGTFNECRISYLKTKRETTLMVASDKLIKNYGTEIVDVQTGTYEYEHGFHDYEFKYLNSPAANALKESWLNQSAYKDLFYNYNYSCLYAVDPIKLWYLYDDNGNLLQSGYDYFTFDDVQILRIGYSGLDGNQYYIKTITTPSNPLPANPIQDHDNDWWDLAKTVLIGAGVAFVLFEIFKAIMAEAGGR